MLDSFYTSVGALQAHQVRLDSVSNNLANVNTPAFKKARVSFEDLMYRPIKTTAPSLPDGTRSYGAVGLGTGIVRTDRMFTQGDLRQTDRSLDLAVQGRGFFELEMPDGSMAYSRLGSLGISDSGMLTGPGGHALSQQIAVPPDAIEIRIEKQGEVMVKVPGESELIEIGRLDLVGFSNPGALEALGEGLYKHTEAAGTPIVGRPGEAGLGLLSQGFLEASNVDFVEELVELVAAQRAYQLNARLLQASDEILAEINGLRR